MHDGWVRSTTAVFAAALWAASVSVAAIAITRSAGSRARMPLTLADIWLLVGAASTTAYIALTRHAGDRLRQSFEHGYLAARSDLTLAQGRRRELAGDREDSE